MRGILWSSEKKHGCECFAFKSRSLLLLITFSGCFSLVHFSVVNKQSGEIIDGNCSAMVVRKRVKVYKSCNLMLNNYRGIEQTLCLLWISSIDGVFRSLWSVCVSSFLVLSTVSSVCVNPSCIFFPRITWLSSAFCTLITCTIGAHNSGVWSLAKKWNISSAKAQKNCSENQLEMLNWSRISYLNDCWQWSSSNKFPVFLPKSPENINDRRNLCEPEKD